MIGVVALEVIADRVDHAARIVADGQDDNETLIICLAVTELNTEAHIVAAVENNVRRTGHDEYTMSLPMPADELGMTARECPEPSCAPGYFKINLPAAGLALSRRPA